MLPEDALKPAWNARWKSINLVAIPPELANQAKNGQPNDGHHYFSAQGTFPGPAKIPHHFRRAVQARPRGGGQRACADL